MTQPKVIVNKRAWINWGPGKKKVGWGFLFVGLATLIYASYMSFDSIRTSNWPSVSGEVTESRRGEMKQNDSNSLNRAYRYYLTIGYTVEGKTYEATTRTGYVKSDPTVGDSRLVRYNPSNHEENVLGTPSIWPGILFSVVGLGLAAGGFFIVRSAQKEEQ